MKRNHFIEAQSNRDFQCALIQKLKTGDLVKVRSERFSFIYHFGIICREFDEFVVFHNDPDKLNISGGNVIREDFEQWIKNREIVEVSSTTLDMANIENAVKELARSRYNLLDFNCEHFVSKLRDKHRQSPQVLSWAIILAATLTALILIRKSK